MCGSYVASCDRLKCITISNSDSDYATRQSITPTTTTQTYIISISAGRKLNSQQPSQSIAHTHTSFIAGPVRRNSLRS